MSQCNNLMSQCNNLMSQCNILISQCNTLFSQSNNLMSQCNICCKILAEGLLASLASITGCYIVTMTKKYKIKRFTSFATFVSDIDLNYSFLVTSKLMICTKQGINYQKTKKLGIVLHCDTFNKTFVFWLPNAYFPI